MALENRLLAALPSETLSALERHLKQVSLAQGEILFEAGSLIDQVYFPQNGTICLLIVTEDGDMVESATVGAEGAAGLHRAFGERVSFTRAAVQIGGRFLTVGGHALEQICGISLPLREMITRYTEVVLAEAQQIAACNALHPASSRLCRWLLATADRMGSDNLPLTQEFLAQMLAVRRTTITLLAQELQREKVIDYRRGRIRITDREALERRACECYRATQHANVTERLGLNGK